MADSSDFFPIRDESLDAIIARIDADLNAGIAPDDDDFIDTTEGTFYADIRTAFALELERLWDVATRDTIAASLIEYAWGSYLDAHGEPLAVFRRDEVASTGEVTFTGTDGTIIGTGAEVSTSQVNPDDEPVSFLTTDDGVIGETVTGELTLSVEAAEPGAAGNVPSGAVTLLLSPLSDVSTVINDAAMTGGADVESDEAYRDRIKLAWAAAQGLGSVADYQRWVLAVPGIGFVRVTPEWAGAGTVRVTVTDTENNPVSDELLAEIQDLLDPYDAETLSDGTQSPTTTFTVVDTTDFKTAGRILVGDTLIFYTGKTSTTFTGCSGFSGSVPDGTTVVQAGSGNGQAPVGALVTVRTAQTVAVDVDLSLELSDGYSIDGAVGTLPVGPEVTESLREYIDNQPPGAEPAPGTDTGAGFVVLNRVIGLAVRVPGVFNVGAIAELDGTAANFAVDANKVPELGTVTLTVE